MLANDMSKMRESMTDLAERNIALEKIIKQMAMKQGIQADMVEDEEEEEPSISQI